MMFKLRKMMFFVQYAVASALRKPERGVLGWITTEYVRFTNGYLEENAVKLLELEANHRVLEIGFGPGIGLSAAHKIIQTGTGKVYGVETSPYALQRAFKRFEKQVAAGRMELHLCGVGHLPFPDSKFDRVIHCNCYYYYFDSEIGVNEIYRVMKPGGLMVTTLCLESIRAKRALGLLLFSNADPIMYMTYLERSGFVDVHFEYLKDGKRSYQAIYCRKKS